jgi:uncharacterized membrane protein (DUF4010 family)
LTGRRVDPLINVEENDRAPAVDQTTLNLFGRLGISLVIGMLVGLQREQTDAALAGMRTFALIAIAGTLAAVLDRHFLASGWILAASYAAIGAIVVVSELRLGQDKSGDVGMTTAVAILVVFAVGAYLAEGVLIVGVAIGVSVAALLLFKPELHSIARKLGDRDMRAIIQFAVLSCVILPVLPNENMGPMKVFNPFNIWLMVVLIVGISLSGYIAYKFFGQSAGALVGGILGGAISSTATSISYSKISRRAPSMAGVSTAAIVIASTVVFARVLIELLVVAPGHVQKLGLPMVCMLAASSVAAVVAWWMFRGRSDDLPEPKNPSEFKSAIMFGALYALVLWGLAIAEQFVSSDAGLYAVAMFAGLTDMDAITLSTGRMVQQATSELTSDVGWRLLVTAAIANLLFKSAIVAFVGGRKLFFRVAALFSLPMLIGVLLLALWTP